MRISDCSSDVCSSDLLSVARAEPALLPILNLYAGSDVGTVTPYVRYSQALGRIDTLGVADILAAPLRPVVGSTIHFGPPGQKTMVVVKVRNASATQGSWIFTTGRGSLSSFPLSAQPHRGPAPPAAAPRP